jgi:hypothetical protein
LINVVSREQLQLQSGIAKTQPIFYRELLDFFDVLGAEPPLFDQNGAD